MPFYLLVKMKNKTEFWTIFFDVLKFIFTLGISHINKRKERLNNGEGSDSTTSL